MRRFFAIVALASLTAAAGCQQDQKSLSKAPPPPPANPSASTDHATPPVTFSVGNDQTQSPAPAGANQSQSTQAAQPQPMRTAPAAPAAPAPAPAAVADHYTIRKGDTLWSIAKRMLGDGQKWPQIVDANPGLNPKKLRVGQKIVIPQ